MKGLGVIKHFGLLIITASLVVKLSLHSDSYIFILTEKLLSVLNITLTGDNIACLISAIFFQMPA